MIVRKRQNLKAMWDELRQYLEAEDGECIFSILIQYNENSQIKNYLMKLVAEVQDGKIVEVQSYNEGQCLLINFKDLFSSKIQYTEDCTEPPLPQTGNRDFLTEIKLQLMFGLSDLDEAEHASYYLDRGNKAVNIFNQAQIGYETLTPYKLISEGKMTYSKYGFTPINWGNNYDIFLDKLSSLTLNDLEKMREEIVEFKDEIDEMNNPSNLNEEYNFFEINDPNIAKQVTQDLVSQINTFTGSRMSNSSKLVRDILKGIRLDRSDDSVSKLCEKIMKVVLLHMKINNQITDKDLSIEDPEDNDFSIYRQSTTESKQYDASENLKHKYVIAGYRIEDTNNNYYINRNNNTNNTNNRNNRNNLKIKRKRGRNNRNNNTHKKPKINGGKMQRRKTAKRQRI